MSVNSTTIYLIDSLKIKRGSYQFRIYTEAKGGATYISNIITLTVSCGPNSASITTNTTGFSSIQYMNISPTSA